MDNQLIVGLLDFTHYIFELIGSNADDVALTTVRLGDDQTSTYLDPIPLLRQRIAQGAILEKAEVNAFLARLLELDALPPLPDSDPDALAESPGYEKARKIEAALKVADFFERFFRSRGTWEIDHVELVGRFDLELELWQRRRYPRHGVAILAGFDSQPSSLILSETIALKRLSPLAREYYRPRSMEEANFFLLTDYNQCGYYLEYGSAGADESVDLPDEVHLALTALKLLKTGDFGVLFCREERAHQTGFLARLFSPPRHARQERATMWEHFVLLEEDVEPLQKILAALEKAPPRYGFCLRRFAQSYERFYAEDRLLDYVAILKSLSNTEGESPKRTAKWCAQTLSAAPQGAIHLTAAVSEHVQGILAIARHLTEDSLSLSDALSASDLTDESPANVLRHTEHLVRWALRLEICGPLQ